MFVLYLALPQELTSTIKALLRPVGAYLLFCGLGGGLSREEGAYF